VQYLTGDIVNLKGKNEKLRKENIELHHCANCWETRFDDGKDSPCISGNKCVNYSHRKGFNNE
jgi:hypothetical protein